MAGRRPLPVTLESCQALTARAHELNALNEDILLAPISKSSNVHLPPVKAGGRGVETSPIKLGHGFSGAGWHARMSSR